MASTITYTHGIEGAQVLNYFRLDLNPPIPELVTTEVTRPNIDGVALKESGTRAKSFQVRGMADVEAATAAALQDHINKYMGCQGAGVVVVDDHGMTWNDMFVMLVQRPQVQPITNAIGGLAGEDATHLLTVTMTMVDTSTAAPAFLP